MTASLFEGTVQLQRRHYGRLPFLSRGRSECVACRALKLRFPSPPHRNCCCGSLALREGQRVLLPAPVPSSHPWKAGRCGEWANAVALLTLWAAASGPGWPVHPCRTCSVGGAAPSAPCLSLPFHLSLGATMKTSLLFAVEHCPLLVPPLPARGRERRETGHFYTVSPAL